MAEDPISKQVLINAQTVEAKTLTTKPLENTAKDSSSRSKCSLVGSMTVIGVVRRVAFGYLSPLERGIMIPLPLRKNCSSLATRPLVEGVTHFPGNKAWKPLSK